MLRLLILIIIVYLVSRFFLRGLSSLPKKKDSTPRKNIAAEEMVACSMCGTYFLKSQGGFREGRFYCDQHLQK